MSSWVLRGKFRSHTSHALLRPCPKGNLGHNSTKFIEYQSDMIVLRNVAKVTGIVALHAIHRNNVQIIIMKHCI